MSDNIYQTSNIGSSVEQNSSSEVTQEMIDGVAKGKGWTKFMLALFVVGTVSVFLASCSIISGHH